MSKEAIVKKLLEENVESGVKYHSPLPVDLSQWYVYTRVSGHRILCVVKKYISDGMSGSDYEERLVSAPVKTVLRGYAIQDGFVVVDSEYSDESGFVSEHEDREFEPGFTGTRYKLSVGEPYLPGTSTWPEAVEYNYFSGNHELRFFVKSPTRYITEVIRKMPVQLGLFTRDDIILLVYKFTDYKKHFVPVHGYSPFSIHLVPENLRTLPDEGADREELLRIHLVDADTGILTAARSVLLSGEFSAALRTAIVEQGKKPMAGDYDERLRELDAGIAGTDSLMDLCAVKCTA